MCNKLPSIKGRLTREQIILRSYTGEQLGLKGVLNVDVTQGDQLHELPLVVIEANGQNLLGWNWLKIL